MTYIKALIICCITFLTACGGSDSPTGNASAPPATPAIDGPKQDLLTDEDEFISTESDDLSLRDIEAPITQDFTASKQQQITISSQSGDSCHINIYTRYNKKGLRFTPSQGGRVLQMYSDSCEYTGMVYLLNQQHKLLVEVINLNAQDTTTYYEKTVQASGIEIII